MSLNELLTILVAVYGAGLATFLAIREAQKEKKRIRIFLQFTNWASIFTLKISNIGHRPITISGVSFRFKKIRDGKPIYEVVPEGAIFRVKEGTPFLPTTLEDGKQVELFFSDVVNNILHDDNVEPGIGVFDAEGNHYGGFERLVFDDKYNFYGPIPNRWKRPRRFLGIRLPVRIFDKK